MRIVSIRAHHVRIPLRKAIRHASHRRTETDNLIVVCRLDSGEEGMGEGVPRAYVTGETIDSCLDLLRRMDWDPILAADPKDFPQAVRLADQLRLPAIDGDTRQCQGNAARCALELSVLDAFGKAFGQPLSEATRLAAPDLWQPRDSVQYSGAITSARGLKARAAAWMMRLYGFRQLKVKVGIAGYNDRERLAIIRRRVGRGMDLRLDANEAWSPEEAVDRIRALEPYGISCVEQPVPHEQVQCLAEVRHQVRTPIMHDESLCSMVDAEYAVRDATCDLFNLRLSKCGGFLPSLRLAEFARRHGLGCQLGCQVGETALLSAAGRHFACSVRDLRYLEGSYDRRLVRESLGKTDITFGYGGRAPALTGPGLGVEVDPEALARVTIREEPLART